MKTLKTILAALTLLTLSFKQAEAKTQQDTTIKIKTSAQCEQCKKRIENKMAFEKGVRKVNLNIETSMLEVVFDRNKTSIEKLRTAVAKIGYDADEMKADEKAYKKLPKCCKKP